MKHFTLETIDHARYKPTIRIQVSGGSRPRVTLEHAITGKRFLFKTYSHNSREVWAECLASHLGEIFGIPIQKVVIKKASTNMIKILKGNYGKYLPSDWKPIGTLARDIFLKDEEIVYGAKIVGTASDALTLSQIETDIRKQYYAPEDLLQSFAQMIVFDAIIGNMDRHHENWGIVEHLQYRQQLLFGKNTLVEKRHFVPLYDHGSSLMFEIKSEGKIGEYLANEDLFRSKYIFGANYSFLKDTDGNECNVFEVIRQNIIENTEWGKRFKKAVLPLGQASLMEIAKAIAKMPNAKELDYSTNRKELLIRSIIIRRDELLSML
ncbi:MAG: HipA domain protein [Candidatus Saccharibacteria bacterium]|nr:HipA domain protein [Candidatus Saccharibacteria bacterium]